MCIYIKPSPSTCPHHCYTSTSTSLFKTKAPKAQRLLPLEDWAGAAPIAYVSRLREGAGE